jgi:hypothetical protein
MKIAKITTKFRGCALVWYMKLQTITPTRHDRNLAEINKALIKEFKNPNLES